MNTEDRELLELAAKAAGVRDFVFCAETGAPFDAVGYWNPLEDDGDALRLAVKLRIDLKSWIFNDFVVAETHIQSGRGIPLQGDYTPPVNDHKEPRGTDDCAATRRAIVRAAAEIGRRMA